MPGQFMCCGQAFRFSPSAPWVASWWRSGQSVGLATQKVAVRISAVPLSDNNLGQVVYTWASVAKQYNLVLVKVRWCHAAGKVTLGLASQWPRVKDFSGLSTCIRAHGLRKGDEHPAYTSRGYGALYRHHCRVYVGWQCVILFHIYSSWFLPPSCR